jgi:hypothetical protein
MHDVPPQTTEPIMLAKPQWYRPIATGLRMQLLSVAIGVPGVALLLTRAMFAGSVVLAAGFICQGIGAFMVSIKGRRLLRQDVVEDQAIMVPMALAAGALFVGLGIDSEALAVTASCAYLTSLSVFISNSVVAYHKERRSSQQAFETS